MNERLLVKGRVDVMAALGYILAAYEGNKKLPGDAAKRTLEMYSDFYEWLQREV